MDETERRIRAVLPARQRWAALSAAAEDDGDAGYFWEVALEVLVEVRDFACADRVMVEHVIPGAEFSGQPDLMFLHAQALRGLGRSTEAIRCVRSALQDMWWHEPYTELLAALLAEAP